MFLTKLALYGTIFGTFFAVSAFSTVQISKQLNKAPVPNETSEDEDDDEELFTRELSDTEKFIKEVTGFGNLRGNLDLTVNKDAFDLTVRGDVFVSMETMDDVQVQATLNITTLGHTYHVEGAYLNDTIYASIEGNNVKLNTSSLSDITTLFSSVSTGVDLPDAFKNIDTNQLLSNLSAMTSEKGENSITYTCNLIDGIPPIIFVTDLNYKLTNVSISGFDFEGYKINATASIDILGKGHNEIKVDDANYIDLTNDINTMKSGLASQISTLINKKEIGISNYNIEVLKRKSEIINEKEVISNELIFNMNGSADVSLSDLNNISKCQVNLNGHMSNTNVGKELDSNVDIKLYEGSVYFDYNNQLKLKYAVSDIEDLVEIIKTKINNNSTTDISAVLDKVFPANSTTTSAPIVSIIKNKQYGDILNYYRSTTIDPFTHNLTVNFDGSLIGNTGATISLSLATGNKGIDAISISGIYALGYVLNINLELDSFKSFSMSENQMNSYTNLGYINNIFDKVTSLVHKDQFALTLNGNLNLGKGDISIAGNSYVSLGETNDFGVAELNITKGTKTHNVKIDVNRNKVSKDATEEEKANALRNSEVLFSYNSNLNGYLNLKSVTETFDLIKQLASEDNPLLSKIKGLLTRDSTQSTLTKVMDGEVEAILYDNSLQSITLKEDTTGYYYDIQINGNLLKSNSTDVVEPIHIYLNLDNDHEFTGLGLKGMLNNYNIDIDLGIEEASENTLSWKRLTKNSSFYDFRELKTLTEYLFNTATNKNFRIVGTVDVSLLSPFTIIADINVSEKGETVAKVDFKDIPYFIGLTSWSRNSTIYVVEKKVGDTMTRDIYIETTYKDHIWSSTKTDRVKLTTDEFTKNIVYYLVNYTLGLTVDVSSAAGNGNKDIDYSTILKAFNYSEAENIPTWSLTLDVGKLAGTSALNDAVITINGTSTTGSRYLNHVHAELGIVSILSAVVDANVTSFEYDDVKAGYNSAISYANTHSEDAYNQH